mmetsp:Transcript_39720/g.73200  ORF Transcript_39720/g.73200 Transcript_39720/m.73200 type:complete len:571 (+) Transcript_39720:855-2567(+)
MEDMRAAAEQLEREQRERVAAVAQAAEVAEAVAGCGVEAAACAAALAEEHANAVTALSEEHAAAREALEKEFGTKVAAAEAERDELAGKVAKLDSEWREKCEAQVLEANRVQEEAKAEALEAQAKGMQALVDEANALRSEAKEQYLEENKKRKEVHNKLIELQGNIRVFARCRPMVTAELKSGKCDDVTAFPTDEDIVVTKDAMTKTKFEFDQVFQPASEQVAVFTHVRPFVTSFLDGYNVCIFAYGQTGSGKTFTMDGPPDNRGVNLRSIEELFKLQAERSEEYDFEFVLSYLEIYNEAVFDLLSDAKGKNRAPLEIRQSPDGGNVVPGLKEVGVTSSEQVVELMARGGDNRKTGSHDMNEHSSRSHSILTLTCVGTPKNGAASGGGGKGKGGGGLPLISSKLHLIDLAGSERISKTDAVGERLKEAQAINKSLSALGDVISALGGKKGTHVPYRNSKLTFLLQDSLSGSSKVLMFCNVSPASYNLGETVCSLNFAARCRNVELGAAKKSGTEGAEVKKLRAQVQKLQDDLADLSNAEGGGCGGGGGSKGAASVDEAPALSKTKSPSKR